MHAGCALRGNHHAHVCESTQYTCPVLHPTRSRSRPCRFEFQADGFAVSMDKAEPLTQALKVLDKENKSDFVVDRLYSQYHYSHPPMPERLRAIAAAAKKAL
jgi:Peptidase family M48